MPTQGKCPKCKIRWDWMRELNLELCACPDCGTPLERTTSRSVLPYRTVYPEKVLSVKGVNPT